MPPPSHPLESASVPPRGSVVRGTGTGTGTGTGGIGMDIGDIGDIGIGGENTTRTGTRTGTGTGARKRTSWGTKARKLDGKVVGLGEGARFAAAQNAHSAGQKMQSSHRRASARRVRDDLGEEERAARDGAERAGGGPLGLFVLGGYSALKVFAFYLVTVETVLSVLLSVGLTLAWYLAYRDAEEGAWNGGTIDWVLLGFAVVTPLSMAVGIAFTRREQALVQISRIRSFLFHIYLAHCLWDWTGSGGTPSSGRASTDVDWLRHTDSVLEHLVGIGDELTRFLTLPTYSRTRHRMTVSGRTEAARTVEVAYRLFDSLYTQRVMKLTMLCEALKMEGLNHSEASRIRQYERFCGECIELLRVIKTYRTPQALRSFGRVFTFILPPFYASSFAQLALDLNSLGLGVCFAVITPLCLTALFESIQVLEDPFLGFITLDGIDVREEFQVLHWQQLINARKIIFPYAPPFSPSSQLPVLWEVLTEELSNDDDRKDGDHEDGDHEEDDHDEYHDHDPHDVIGTAIRGNSSDQDGIDENDLDDLVDSPVWDAPHVEEGMPAPVWDAPPSLGASVRTMRHRLSSVDLGEGTSIGASTRSRMRSISIGGSARSTRTPPLSP